MNQETAPIAITMGDPCGIGPEIVAKTLAREAPTSRTVVIGSARVMENAVRQLGLDLGVRTVAELGVVSSEPGVLAVWETSDLVDLPFRGQVSAAGGKAAYDAIVEAIKLAKADSVSGIVTAPINKAALAAAGVKYPGHTEMLAEFGGAERVAMMLANDEIRTVLVTIH